VKAVARILKKIPKKWFTDPNHPHELILPNAWTSAPKRRQSLPQCDDDPDGKRSPPREAAVGEEKKLLLFYENPL